MDRNLIIYPQDVAERNLKSGMKINSGLYFDKPRERASESQFGGGVEKYNGLVIATPESPRWEASPNFDKLWTEIESKMNTLKSKLDTRKFNAAQFPAEYYDLINMFRLDMSRRRIEAADLTPILAQEIVNPNISRTAALDEFLPFVGAFEENDGRGQQVAMMGHTTGSTASVTQKLYALGDARTLEDALYNSDIFSTMKVMDAYVRAHTAKRNDLLLGTMIAASYDSLQSVAADTGGATADEKLYITLNNAIEALRKLKDPQTGLEIDASRITIACAYGDERRINRVINGQLDNSKGKAANYTALNEIVNIVPYRGDVITVGSRKYTYGGISANTAFVFVAGQHGAPKWVLTKRALTYEVGRGDLFTLVRDGQVGYFSQAQYEKEFLGQAAGTTTGHGYVVKVALPS